MSITTQYDLDPHVAEIYDQFEVQTDDIELIGKVVAGKGALRILEPFCGTGRILIPLASDGHEIVGFDRSRPMLDRARSKIAALPQEVQQRITLFQADVTAAEWPRDFDLVLLGGNCFYELSSSEEQEGCIAAASAASRPGGYVYVDNNHMEGDLEESWRVPGVRATRFPRGVCVDGTRVEGTAETIAFDAAKRLWRACRSVTITFPDGRVTRHEYIEQKHPVSAVEVRTWLENHGFVVEALFGDRSGSPYLETSPRAILWARKSVPSARVR